MASAAHRAGISSPSYSARNSREHLIPKSQRPRSLHGSHVRSSRVLAAERKLANKGGVAIEQKRSHGIGGAGNIRRPSEVIYPVKLNADGTRKRGIAWSSMSIAPGSSHDGMRSALFNMFSRKGSLGGSTSKELEDSEVAIKGSGSGRKED